MNIWTEIACGAAILAIMALVGPSNLEAARATAAIVEEHQPPEDGRVWEMFAAMCMGTGGAVFFADPWTGDTMMSVCSRPVLASRH